MLPLLHLLHLPLRAATPNILFMLQDDGGYNGLGFMNERLYPGRPKLHTPQLDALAAAAVKLTSFYVLPLCSPTRSAFLSGFY
jgi:arylsulfatase A-like enzyme